MTVVVTNTIRGARRVWPVVLVVLVVGIGGCGDSQESAVEPTQTPTSTPTTDSASGSASADAVSWAGGVCAAVDGVEQSLDALGASLEVDLSSDEAIVDQLAPQVQEQVGVVSDDVEALTSALTDVPEDADPEVVAAAEDLQADRQSLEDSVAGLREAASGLSEATDAASLAQGVAAVAAQLGAVQLNASAFVDTLQTTVEQGATAVRAAFTDAPECSSRV